MGWRGWRRIARGWELRWNKWEEEEDRCGEEGGRGWVEEVSDLYILCCLLIVS